MTSEQECAHGGVIVLLRRIACRCFLTAAPLALGPDVRVVAFLARALRVLDVAAFPDGALLTDAAASLLTLLSHSNPHLYEVSKVPRLGERGEAALQ